MKRCSCKWNIERQAIVHFCLQRLSNEKQVSVEQRLLFLSFFPLRIELVRLAGTAAHPLLKNSPLGITPANTVI